MRALLERLSSHDLAVCLRCNRRAEWLPTQQFYQVVSRLGDGIFWYLLMMLMPALFGTQGLTIALHMLLSAGLSLAIYKLLKQGTGRARPCDRHPAIRRHAPALDRYSFPSGHTMHAVGFTVVVASHLPALGLLLLPFTLLVALSRMVLGLHYPSDVLAGAAIGTTVALLSRNLLF